MATEGGGGTKGGGEGGAVAVRAALRETKPVQAKDSPQMTLREHAQAAGRKDILGVGTTKDKQLAEKLTNKEAFVKLMNVAEANPKRGVQLADQRKAKEMGSMDVLQLARLEWSARVGKPNHLEKCRVAAALARAGVIHLYFEQLDWIHKEFDSNPYFTSPSHADQAGPDGNAPMRNESGVNCAAVNRLLELMHAEIGWSTTRRLPFDAIMKLGGASLEDLVSWA